MNFFLENKKAIINRNLNLDILFRDDIELNQNFKVYTELTLDGDTCIAIEKDGDKYRLNSTYSPSQQAMFWVSQFKYNKENIVTSMYGLGNGYIAKAIASNMGKNDFIIIIEPSKEIFLCALQNYDLTDLISNPRVMIVIMGINNDKWSEFFGLTVNWENISDQIYCSHPGYTKVFPIEAKEFQETIRKSNETVIISKNTSAYFGKKFVFNMLDSLHCLPKMNSLEVWKHVLTGDIPGIIIAAGPSLDENVLELKHAKGKAILFATDRALPTLFKNDIIPDFIVTVDPDKADACFENPISKELPLICPAHAKQEALENHQGKIFLASCYEYIGKLFKKLGSDIPVFNTGYSVATTAFSICLYLGLKNIILVGQDLAYKGEISHTGGEIEPIGFNEERYVEGVNGKLVKTRFDWESFQIWFENKIKTLDKEINVIDATEGGALIHGTKVMTLHNTIEKYCNVSIDFEEMLNNIPIFWSKEKAHILYDYVMQSIYECSTLIEKSEEIIDICQRCKEILGLKQFDKEILNLNKERILETNEYLKSLSIYSLIDLVIFKTATAKHKELNINPDDEFEVYLQVFSIYEEVYHEMLDMVKEMKARFEKQLEIIQED